MNERPGQAGALALIVVTCLAAAADALPTGAQPRGEPAEVLVLGVYHMSNPGRDVFNTEADDVLSPKRQAAAAATPVKARTGAAAGAPAATACPCAAAPRT